MTIPERLHPTIHTFCSDMWDGYLGAIADFMAAHPEIEAKVVIDRFHVAKNYREEFDKLRKKELCRLKQELPEETYKEVVQGMQFTAHPFTDALEAAGIRISMDGRGRAFDNIFVERLWRSVKHENIYINRYETVPALITGLGEYFHLYNYKRPHQSLDYLTPTTVHFTEKEAIL